MAGHLIGGLLFDAIIVHDGLNFEQLNQCGRRFNGWFTLQYPAQMCVACIVVNAKARGLDQEIWATKLSDTCLNIKHFIFPDV